MESDMPVNSILETSVGFSFLQETNNTMTIKKEMTLFMEVGFMALNIREYFTRPTWHLNPLSVMEPKPFEDLGSIFFNSGLPGLGIFGSAKI